MTIPVRVITWTYTDWFVNYFSKKDQTQEQQTLAFHTSNGQVVASCRTERRGFRFFRGGRVGGM